MLFEEDPQGASTPRRSAGDDSPTVTTHGLQILLAEDMAITGAVVRAVLETAGHRVDVATDGAEAVKAASAGSYNLIFMDVQMPVLGGVSATRMIRALPGPVGHVPIVALTAENSRFDRAGLSEAGMDGHVHKPLRKAELLEAVERWGRASQKPPNPGSCARDDDPGEVARPRAAQTEAEQGDKRQRKLP